MKTLVLGLLLLVGCQTEPIVRRLSMMAVTNTASGVIDQNQGMALLASYQQVVNKSDYGFREGGKAIVLWSVTNLVSKGAMTTNWVPILMAPKPPPTNEVPKVMQEKLEEHAPK